MGGAYPPGAGYPPSFPNTAAPGYPPSGAYPPPVAGSPQQPYPPQYGTTYPNAPPTSGNPPPSSFPPSSSPYPNSPPAGYPPAAAYPPSTPAPPGTLPGTTYPSQAPGTIGPVPIALDVALLRKQVVNGRVVPVPINDGDVLRDGRGDPQAGDKFKIVFRPYTDCFIYIIAIDGSGWAQGLFPSKHSAATNPVRNGQEYVLPEGPYWYSPDQYRGIETIYFVASYQQRADIEQILTKIAGRERSATAVPAKVEQAPVLPDGFGGAQPGPPAVVQTETGTVVVMPTTFFAKQAGDDLRVTRWFRHE